MPSPSRLAFTFSLLVLPSLTHAQELRVHTTSGDPAPGGNQIDRPLLARVDDAGQVLRLLMTNQAADDLVLAMDDQLLLRQGQLIEPQIVLDDFLQLSWSPSALAAILAVQSPTVPSGVALYRNGQRIAMVGAPLLASGVGPGTILTALDALQLNEEGTLLVLGEADDPAIVGAQEPVLLLYRFGPQGALLSAEVVARKGQTLPVLGAPIEGFLSQSSALALNARGDFLCVVTDGADQATLLLNLAFNLAREGDVSPLRDRRYDRLDLSSLTLNDHRDYAFTALLDGEPTTAGVLIKNGAKFVQQGDVVPAFSADPIGSPLSFAPVRLSDGGAVFWRATTAGDGEQAYLRGRDVIVRKGQQVAGRQVTAIPNSVGSFSISPDGRHWIGRVALDGAQALITADFGLVTRFGGCRANDADLSHAGGLALPGETLQFTMTRGQVVGALPVLTIGTRRLGPCGVMTAAGEALLEPSSLIATYTGPNWTGAPSAFSIDVPNTLSLVNQEFFAQGAFLDVGDQSPAANVRLTNGLQIQIGAP